MTLSLPIKTEADMPPIRTVSDPFGNGVCQSGERIHVGNAGSAIGELREEEREAAAYRAGVAMQAWYSRYQATGDRQALSIAHRHMTQMVAILAKGLTNA